MSRQKISTFILCLLLLSAAACGQGADDDLDSTISSVTPADTDDHPPEEGSVVVNEDVDGATALRESDAYELETDGDHAPVIEDDTLTLTISYGGGCETHDFALVTDGRFMESDPVQLAVILTHDANDDPCERYVTDSYTFDLASIKTLYQENYSTDEGPIILNLRHLGDPGALELKYTLAP